MIHPTADVSSKAIIGEGTQIWNWVQVRENAMIGKNCILSKGVYIDPGVVVGNLVKIGNNVSLYNGVTIEDFVFIAPHVCFTNDKFPRSVTPEGKLKKPEDWIVYKTLVKKGASIGAGSVIVCGITIGEWAMVGAGSVVTKDVPDYALVFGNPAQLKGWVCKCGDIISKEKVRSNVFSCHECLKC